jgi:hypothetical protein
MLKYGFALASCYWSRILAGALLTAFAMLALWFGDGTIYDSGFFDRDAIRCASVARMVIHCGAWSRLAEWPDILPLLLEGDRTEAMRK